MSANKDELLSVKDNESKAQKTYACLEDNKTIHRMTSVPKLRNGKVIGFRVMRLVPGGFMERIGVHTDDILVKVNTTVLDV